jgi:hypothetical protein
MGGELDQQIQPFGKLTNLTFGIASTIDGASTHDHGDFCRIRDSGRETACRA